jgi:phage shock protein E
MWQTNPQQTLKNAQFEAQYSPDTLILDVRTPMEYQGWHLDGAVNVPTSSPVNRDEREGLNIFIANLLRFSRRRGRPIVVYCRRGVRAAAMENALMNAGFHNVINLGGIDTMPLRMLRQRGIMKL